MPNSVDLKKLVKSVMDDFASRDLSVDEGVYDELLAPALPHQSDVDRDLAAGKITEEFLRSCVQDILTRAGNRAQSEGLRRVTEHHVRQAMAEDCPYRFWC